MGKGKGNVEGVNIDHLFRSFLIHKYTTRGKNCCGYPTVPTRHRLRLPTHSSRYTRIFYFVPATAFLALQDPLIPDLFWCATGEATLAFGRGVGGPSERGEGGSAKVSNGVLAFAFPPGSTLVARSDDLRGNIR